MTQIKRPVRRRRPWATKINFVALSTLIFLFFSLRATKRVESFLRKSPNGLGENRCNVLTDSKPAELSKLEKLNLKGCNLNLIPKNIRFCTNLREIDVSDNPLSTLPQELRYCDKLEILFVSSCPNIRAIPSVLGEMESITRLGWRSGSLTSVDANAIPPNLIHFILTDNKIKAFDDPLLFKKLQHVRKLMLSHNDIESFGGHLNESEMIHELKNLELLRLAGNHLTSIPSRLWTLPKLTWLTISGNPATNGFKTAAANKNTNLSSDNPPVITMSDLQSTGKYLGKGASGKVEVYKWEDRPVAVKLIHGVTSDGKAEDELAVYRAVGSNGMSERVVGCLALLDDDKLSKKGVVMEQLPGNLDDFALPPTIVEVTADRWQDDLEFSSMFVINALRDVASALHFLHATIGIAHGDVYAHNMKVDWETGNVYLLDFGASYFTGEYSAEAERLEVRAFGILVGELVDLMSKNDQSSLLIEKALLQLYSKCVDDDVKNRPFFSQIKKVLRELTI